MHDQETTSWRRRSDISQNPPDAPAPRSNEKRAQLQAWENEGGQTARSISPVRVLIIDNDIGSADSLELMLHASGYSETRVAYSGHAALAIAAKARNSVSSEPHFHIFPDMDFQPKFKSDTECDIFPDLRCNRGEIPGTVARGGLHADDTLYRGLEDGQWTTGFPRQLEVNEAFVRRGQGRFNIYCTPCHGYDGRGMGAVPSRLLTFGASWAVRNLVDPAATPARMPNGQLFNTISNGFNTMMGYAQQIPPEDRWAIVAYVRAMQRAFNATLEDVRPEKRASMPPPQVPATAPPAPAAPAPAAPEPAAPGPATPTPAPPTPTPAPAGGAK